MRDWLSYRAGIDPGREALADTATDTSYTFGTLDTLVDDLAGRLAAVGVDTGTHLGAVLRPCVEYACLIHAAMRLGATLVPMGDGLTARELSTQVAAADVDTIICGDTTEDAVAGAVAALDCGNADAAALASRFPVVSRTGFGSPVVPDVKRINCVSSSDHEAGETDSAVTADSGSIPPRSDWSTVATVIAPPGVSPVAPVSALP